MFKTRIALLSVFASSVLFVPLMSQPAQAGVRIGGSSLRANGQVAQNYEYSGPCPVDLKFGWGVIASSPTAMTYTFSRNDGGHSSTPQRTDLPQPNRSTPIYDEWHLGANRPQFANYRGWVQINIMSPNPVSQKIPFTIHCQ